MELMGISFPFLILFVLAAIIFSVMYYRNTVPPVYGWKKWMLVSLRASALTLLLVILAEPVLKILATITKKSRTAVLIDSSSSMDQNYDPGRKSEALNAFNEIRSNIGNDGVFYSFDSRFRILEQGKPDFSGSGTNLLTAITQAGNQDNVSSILLISDGRWNLGEDPAGSGLPVEIPVHTVTVGSSESITDVVINKISAAPIGHEGENIPVELTISSTIEMPEPVPVEVVENGRVLASGTVSFRNGTTARTTFTIPLSGNGDHTFTAVIKPGNDEYTENNTRAFSVHVVKSSFRIIIAADKPSADLSFLRRAIEQEDALELEIIVDKGVYGTLKAPFPDDLSGFDAMILLNWCGSALTPQRAETVKKWVSAGGGLWILGSSTLSAGADVIKSILPVIFSNTNNFTNTQFYMDITEAGSTHFITSGEVNRENAWNSLPPLSFILPVSRTASDGQVLAKAVMPASVISM